MNKIKQKIIFKILIISVVWGGGVKPTVYVSEFSDIKLVYG